MAPRRAAPVRVVPGQPVGAGTMPGPGGSATVSSVESRAGAGGRGLHSADPAQESLSNTIFLLCSPTVGCSGRQGRVMSSSASKRVAAVTCALGQVGGLDDPNTAVPDAA